MILRESDGANDETPHSKKKVQTTCKKGSEAGCEAPLYENSLSSLSRLQAENFEKCYKREELEALLRAVHKFYFRALKMGTSDERHSTFSSSGSFKPIFTCSPDRLQHAAPKSIQVAQEEHHTKLTSFEDGIFLEPSVVFSASLCRTAVLLPPAVLLYLCLS